MTLEPHSLSDADLIRLASGPIDVEFVHLLRRTRLSRIKLLLLHLYTDEARSVGLLGALAAARTPACLDALLAHPWVGVWAEREAHSEPPARDLQFLCGLVAAQACKLRAPLPPVVSARAAMITLPGIGLLRDLSAWGSLISGEELPESVWQPLRTACATHLGRRITLVIDDLDPVRRCYGLPLTERLNGSQIDAWRAGLADAWDLIAEYTRDYAGELEAGMTMVVPLSSAGGEVPILSATHRAAFGACALNLPDTACDLAAALVHEFQHSKLNALMDLLSLHDPSRGGRYFAPWRSDSRPIGAMLHGLYAFTAVAEFWDSLRVNQTHEEYATFQFATIRSQVGRAVESVRNSSGLTQLGARFVSGITQRVNRLMDHPIDAKVDRLAWSALDLAEQRWRESFA